MREQSNVGQRVFYTFAETLTDHAWTGDLSLQPGLAESWRRIDGCTLELKLRQDARFHNGDGRDCRGRGLQLRPGADVERQSVDTRGMWIYTTPASPARCRRRRRRRSPWRPTPGSSDTETVDKYTVRFVNRVPDATLEGRLRATAA